MGLASWGMQVLSLRPGYSTVESPSLYSPPGSRSGKTVCRKRLLFGWGGGGGNREFIMDNQWLTGRKISSFILRRDLKSMEIQCLCGSRLASARSRAHRIKNATHLTCGPRCVDSDEAHTGHEVQDLTDDYSHELNGSGSGEWLTVSATPCPFLVNKAPVNHCSPRSALSRVLTWWCVSVIIC